MIRVIKGEFQSLITAGAIFRHIQFSWSRRLSTSKLKKCIEKHGAKRVGQEILSIVSRNIDSSLLEGLRQSFVRNDRRPFNQRMLILSQPKDGRLGVIHIKFTEYFKYFAKIFNISKLAQDYILICEPSFSGYFDEDILLLTAFGNPVIVQSAEPVDFQFVKELSSNLYPINIGANWWVDDRIFFPLNNSKKIYDIIVVAIWADFKRHYCLFEALAKCKNELRISLVGKPWPKSLEEVKNEARYFGVIDRIDFFEDVSQIELNLLLNKSKCYFLLSKKEGFNKSIIEALYANVPVFMLEGFNFGHQYAYINSKTGGFIKPKELHRFLNNIDSFLKEKKFAPNQWVKENMSYKIARHEVVKMIDKIEKAENVKVNKNVVFKVNNPNLDYLDSDNWYRFKANYRQMPSYFNTALD